MKIVIISGSTRPQSQSRKVADVLTSKIDQQFEPEILDLFETQLPLYDDSERVEWASVHQLLEQADGHIWVCPEWNGTAGPGIMNLLAYLTKEMMHKPVLLVGVSDGIGGAYPLAQLRAFGSKNTHAVFVPESLRFLHAKTLFNSVEPDASNDTDVKMHERAQHAVKVSQLYTRKLHELRTELGDAARKYPSGC